MKLRQTKIQNLFGRISTYSDWWKVIPPFNKFYNKISEHSVTLRTGTVMHIRNIFGYDLPILYEIFTKDEYNLNNLILPHGAVVFDVGAHIGSFSVAVHDKYTDAVLIAFEPHPDNFAFLQKNAPFARCINKAIAGSAGTVHLGDHEASPSYALSDSGIAVEAVTLGSHIAQVPHVDLLKVDVEGAEREIFENLEPDMLAKVDRIVMEIHSPHKGEWFVLLFEKAGFEVAIKDNILFATRKGVR